MTRFGKQQISDQKRLVRGEHLLLARKLLRARDAVHHGVWRVLILAGDAPQEEIGAIRELMHKAHITAVDREALCVEAATAAGADTSICCDLSVEESYETLGKLPRFDVVSLDLCAGACKTTKDLISTYRRLLAPRGVFIGTFSFGRDVVEAYEATWDEWRQSRDLFRNTVEEQGFVPSPSSADRAKADAVDHLTEAGVSDAISGRLCSILSPGLVSRLHSIMVYRGHQMPMCSMVFQNSNGRGFKPKLSFVRVAEGDFELAVVYPDTANLYATPRERIDSLRRTFAATKAVHTRTVRNSSLAPHLRDTV